MELKEKKTRKLIDADDLEKVAGGNQEITEDTPHATCNLCGANVILTNGNTMEKHQKSKACEQLRPFYQG